MFKIMHKQINVNKSNNMLDAVGQPRSAAIGSSPRRMPEIAEWGVQLNGIALEWNGTKLNTIENRINREVYKGLNRPIIFVKLGGSARLLS